MAKKTNHSAQKTIKNNPALEAPNPELETQPITEWEAEPTIANPQSEPNPAEDFRAKLVAKAQAARQAAKVGLIPQEQADDL